MKLSFSRNFLYGITMQQHPTHKSAAGFTLIELLMDADVAVRHVESFAAITDIVTT